MLALKRLQLISYLRCHLAPRFILHQIRLPRLALPHVRYPHLLLGCVFLVLLIVLFVSLQGQIQPGPSYVQMQNAASQVEAASPAEPLPASAVNPIPVPVTGP